MVPEISEEERTVSGTGLIFLILIGLAAGWLAGQIMKGGGYGVGGDIVVGIIGAMVVLFGLRLIKRA